MKLKILEKDILRTCLDYLAIKRIFHWRHNSGVMFIKGDKKTRMIRMGQEGSPDIFAVKQQGFGGITIGQIYGIEVKSPTGKQSDNQIEWQKKFEEVGGIYLLVHSLEELQKYL